jgi:hypothetical protein
MCELYAHSQNWLIRTLIFYCVIVTKSEKIEGKWVEFFGYE